MHVYCPRKWGERKGKEEKNRKRKAEEAGSMEEEERDFMDE